jgi:hypothetical protein
VLANLLEGLLAYLAWLAGGGFVDTADLFEAVLVILVLC